MVKEGKNEENSAVFFFSQSVPYRPAFNKKNIV